MKQITTETFCDICKEKAEHAETIKYPVIFYTEQTEGRSTEPYISMENLEVCDECKGKILMVNGWGAQGYNQYKIRES